jgi:hypothetical protein
VPATTTSAAQAASAAQAPVSALRAQAAAAEPADSPDPLLAAADPSSVSVDRVDEFLLETVETMSRTFCGLTARGLCLWQGGVYTMVKLLSEDPGLVQEAVRRAELLWPRILALETLLATPGCPAGVRAFGARFLWLDGVAYRELLCLLSEGQLEFARTYALRVHGSVHHEKGLGKINHPPLKELSHPARPPDSSGGGFSSISYSKPPGISLPLGCARHVGRPGMPTPVNSFQPAPLEFQFQAPRTQSSEELKIFSSSCAVSPTKAPRMMS